MQQSAAFKILRTRLKTVPSYSFNGEQVRRTSSGNPYQIIHHVPSGSQISENGDGIQDGANSHNGINFASMLQQFEQMQRQHHMHTKVQALSRNNSTTSLSVELLCDILSTNELDKHLNENFLGDSDSGELIQGSGMTILTINEVQYSYSYIKNKRRKIWRNRNSSLSSGGRAPSIFWFKKGKKTDPRSIRKGSPFPLWWQSQNVSFRGWSQNSRHHEQDYMLVSPFWLVWLCGVGFTEKLNFLLPASECRKTHRYI